MRLTIGRIHDLYAALSRLEEAPEIKLAGEVRLKVAININALRPNAEAYERTRTRSIADLYAANRGLGPSERKTEPEIQADAMDANHAMREETADLELRTLLKADLRLEDNPKITGAMLAALVPIVEGIE